MYSFTDVNNLSKISFHQTVQSLAASPSPWREQNSDFQASKIPGAEISVFYGASNGKKTHRLHEGGLRIGDKNENIRVEAVSIDPGVHVGVDIHSGAV